MPEIQPFAGVLYRVSDGDLSKVLCPPYDVISPSYRDALYARDPHNGVRLVLNRTPGDAGYAEAGETYRRWLAEGILGPDPVPALYLLEQQFTLGGRALRRTGLLARFRAEDPGGSVLPHEHTRPAAREDRFRVLQATRANFSPIFVMFADAEGRFARTAAETTSRPPDLTCTDDGGIGHRLWRVTDERAQSAFGSVLRSARAYIADGHHRYATALRHRDLAGPDGAWTLGYFTALEDPGLVVLPYHRILSRGPSLAGARKSLEPWFLVNDAADAAAAAAQAAQSTMPYAFGLAEPGAGALVAEALPEAEDLLAADAAPSLRALDTFFLHQGVLPRVLDVPEDAVSYVHSLAEAEEAVATRACRLAVLMRSTPVRQIVAVAEDRQSMPAKSTFFHPKLPSGLVIHPLLA